MKGNLECIKYRQSVKEYVKDQYHSDGRMCWTTNYVEREWTLGRGPCGRYVTALSAEVDQDFLEIRQTCRDHREGQYDTFLIKMSDIYGSIQLFTKLD